MATTDVIIVGQRIDLWGKTPHYHVIRRFNEDDRKAAGIAAQREHLTAKRQCKITHPSAKIKDEIVTAGDENGYAVCYTILLNGQPYYRTALSYRAV